MTRRAVVLFARTPEAEAVAKGLPLRSAALFETLIADWIRVSFAAGATAVLACTPASRKRLSRIAPELPRTYVDQGCGSFGERLAAVANAVASRSDATIIAAIDAPPHDLETAFERLESADVDAIIAPARDGGINAIGFRQAPIDLLETFTVGDADLLARCRRHFDRIYEMVPATDIDSLERFRAARDEGVWVPYRQLLIAPAFGTLVPRYQPAQYVPSATRAPPSA
jgi:glycosyltransferase A (GT-A) superfamily protein (DUF2064 family)